MKNITYIDHSGFIVTASSAILVFDYYRDPARALEKVLKANPRKPVIFFVSHAHEDHFSHEIFHLAQNHQRLYVLSNDIQSQYAPSDLSIAWMGRGDYVENLPGDVRVRAFGSTDRGVSYLVDVPDSDGNRMTVFHAGDFNLWHWQDESTEREVRAAYDRFVRVMSDIMAHVKAIDVVFFPVDPRQGSDYAQGARLFMENIDVKYFVPMHYWGDYKMACDFEQYTTDNTEGFCLHVPGESVSLNGQVAQRQC